MKIRLKDFRHLRSMLICTLNNRTDTDIMNIARRFADDNCIPIVAVLCCLRSLSKEIPSIERRLGEVDLDDYIAKIMKFYGITEVVE
jgi:hypothetical protein